MEEEDGGACKIQQRRKKSSVSHLSSFLAPPSGERAPPERPRRPRSACDELNQRRPSLEQQLCLRGGDIEFPKYSLYKKELPKYLENYYDPYSDPSELAKLSNEHLIALNGYGIISHHLFDIARHIKYSDKLKDVVTASERRRRLSRAIQPRIIKVALGESVDDDDGDEDCLITCPAKMVVTTVRKFYLAEISFNIDFFFFFFLIYFCFSG